MVSARCARCAHPALTSLWLPRKVLHRLGGGAARSPCLSGGRLKPSQSSRAIGCQLFLFRSLGLLPPLLCFYKRLCISSRHLSLPAQRKSCSPTNSKCASAGLIFLDIRGAGVRSVLYMFFFFLLSFIVLPALSLEQGRSTWAACAVCSCSSVCRYIEYLTIVECSSCLVSSAKGMGVIRGVGTKWYYPRYIFRTAGWATHARSSRAPPSSAAAHDEHIRHRASCPMIVVK